MRESFHHRPFAEALIPVVAVSCLALLTAAPLGALPVDVLAEEVPPASPPLPDPAVFPVQLVLDDDNAESPFGLTGASARQFMWLNSFANPGLFTLEEVWVLFPAGGGVSPGDAVQILVYLDPDGDPATGAQLLGNFNQVVQSADGNTFSIYSLGAGIPIENPGDVSIGVVNRFFTTGVDPPPTLPAALDTTAGQNRSFVLLWPGDAPDPPDPATAETVDRLDGLTSGNLMIRGFGTPIAAPPVVAVTEVPTAGTWALIVLAGLLGLAALRFLRFE